MKKISKKYFVSNFVFFILKYYFFYPFYLSFLSVRVKEVKIISSPKKLSIGQSSEFICQSIGSKPAPLFKWLIGDNQLLSLKETTVDDELIATSFLHLIPSASYHKKKLTCMAINTKFNEDNPKDYLILDILCMFLLFACFSFNLKKILF